MTDIVIRLEEKKDHRAVEEIAREAFWNLHVPGCGEHLLAHRLRKHPVFIPALDYVAERDGWIVGNIMYCRAVIRDDSGNDTEVITFGPLSVLPECQRQGIGSALIRHSLAKAETLGYGSVWIYGDPMYYHRFGFKPGKEYGVRTEDGAFMDVLMGLELVKGALAGIAGRFIEGEAYHIDEAELMEFDKTFPHKEKAVTESQKRFAELANQQE